MSVDEFRHIVGYLVQDIVANEHMAEAIVTGVIQIRRTML